jgi:capsular polysaccharide export protein
LLGQPVCHPPFHRGELSALALWGAHSRAGKVSRLARRLGLPWFRVANGFLRPMGRSGNEAPLSVVIDGPGIYEDAWKASRLDGLAGAQHSPAQLERARSLIALWRKGRISEFNDGREETGALPAKYVLILDQAVNPRSISNALAERSSFELMLDAAIAERPDCTLLVKAEPGGYLNPAAERVRDRVQVIAAGRHPAGLLERAEAVYTVSSQLGFEALLWGTPVRTFGVPFYAGWGLTADTMATPSRRTPVALEDLVHAALVEYSRYRHPETGLACEVEEILEWLGLQRRMRERFPATVYAAGFSPRKRRFVRDFLQGSTVRFIGDPQKAPGDAPLALWGRQGAAGDGQTVIRLEDGFLRSVGLGAGLVRPLSWAVDRRGIYYDARMPSEMEELFETMEFDAELLGRAARLRRAIVAGGVTKYNLEVQPWKRPAGVGRVILVPGQVENDASLCYGAPGLRTNLGLLQTVRAANPEAFVVYKPHPDVVAGLRSGGKGEDEAPRWCDEVAPAAAMGQLLLQVDEVHVLTSLAGFEALLRGRGVTCHGQPFYAGWGLTRDAMPVPRRTRRLCLDALVAVTLIVYPTYLSRVTGCYTTPERVLEELRQWRMESRRRKPGPARRLIRRLFHAVLRRIEESARKAGSRAGKGSTETIGCGTVDSTNSLTIAEEMPKPSPLTFLNRRNLNSL